MSNDRTFIGPYADSLKQGDSIRSLDKPQETLQERIERVEWEIEKYQNELRQLQIEKRELGYVDTYTDKRGK